MRVRLDEAVRFPIMKVMADFDDQGYGLMNQWTEITDYVLDVSGSKEKEQDVLGGVSSDLVTLTVDNSTNVFSVDNPNSFFYGKKKKNIRFVLMTGFAGETLVPYVVGYIKSLEPKWRSKEYLLKCTCPMDKLKRADVPAQSFYDVTWNQLVTILLDQAGIEPYFIRSIPQTELYYKYFRFEEQKCFEALKKLMEAVSGQAFFDGRNFKINTELSIGYTTQRIPKHTVLADDPFEFEETINDTRLINKVKLNSEPKEIAPLQIVFETPENFVSVQNEKVVYNGGDYIYVDVKNIPIYAEDGNEEGSISIKNLSNGREIEWDVYNAELGRIKIKGTSLLDVNVGHQLSVSYTYQYLVLLPGQERKFECKIDEVVDTMLEPDIIAWNAGATAQVPYSSNANTPNTLCKQSMVTKEDGALVELTLKNNTAGKVSISTLQFRGYPVRVLNPIEVNNKDDASILEYDTKEVAISNNYINNVRLAEKLCQFIIDNRSEIPKELSITINGYSELLLNDVMAVFEPSSGTDHIFNIERIDFSFNVDSGWTARIDLLVVPDSDWSYGGFTGDSYNPPLRGTDPPINVTAYHKGNTPPTDTTLFWIDTNTNPALTKVYDATIGQWVKTSPTTAEEIGAETPQGAQDKADEARQDAINHTNTEVVKRELTVFKSSTQPVSAVTNQLWIDTSSSPHILKRWTGVEWVKVGPTTAGEVGAVDSSTYLAQRDAILNDLALKANKTYVDAELSAKATLTQLALKADLTFVNGQLTAKADKADTFTKVEVNNALNGKVSVTTYNTDKDGIVQRLDDAESSITQNADQIALKVSSATYLSDKQVLEADIDSKADVTLVNGINGRLTTAETSITQQANQIALKASQSDLNTVLGRLNDAEASITVQAGQIATKAAQTDLNLLTGRMNTAESNITQQASQIALRVTQTTFDTELNKKENNVTKSSTAPSSPVTNALWLDTSTTPNVLKRWNGSAWIKATPTTASEVGAYSQTDGTALNSRLTTAESSITQQAGQIALRVTQTTFDTEIAKKENNVVKQTTAPSSPVTNMLWLDTSVTPNVLKRWSGSAWIKATPTTAAEVGAYSATDGSNLNTRVTTAESSITQQAGQIALKVNQTEFDSLAGRVSTAESSITQQADQIALRVTETTFNNALNLKENSVSKSSTAPAGPTTGQLWLDTSVTPNILKRYSGTAWVNASPTTASHVGAEGSITKSTTAPASPSSGQLWLDTSLTPNVLKRWSGSAWVKATPTTAAEVGAFSQTDGSAITSRMTTAESNITQQAGQIALKVNQTTYDIDVTNLQSRMNTAESSITQQANQIALRVLTTDFNQLNDRVVNVEKTSGNIIDNPTTAGVRGGWSAGVVEATDFKGSSVNALKLTTSGSTTTTSNRMPINIAKAYEISVWVKKTAAMGRIYLGLNFRNSGGTNLGCISVNNATGVQNTNNTNPYLSNTTTAGQSPTDWVKLTGYLLPTGTDPARLIGLQENIAANTQLNMIIPSGATALDIRILNNDNTASQDLFIINPKVVELSSENVLFNAFRLTTAETSITQQAGQIALKANQTTVDAISTGARNYVPNSNGARGTELWNLWQITANTANTLEVSDDAFSSVTGLSCNVTAAGAGLRTPPTVVREGEEYTIAFRMKADKVATLGHLLKFRNSSGTEINPIAQVNQNNVAANTWVLFEQTFVVPAGQVVMDTTPRVVSTTSTYPIKITVSDLVISRGNRRLDWQPSEEDVKEKLDVLTSRINNAEIQINPDSIVQSVTQSTTFNNLLDSKANSSDLTGLATIDEVNDVSNTIDEKIGDFKETTLDPTIAEVQTQIETTAQGILNKFSATGGMNLLRNSIGFAKFDFWQPSSVNTSQLRTDMNLELDALGYGSGFLFPPTTVNRSMTQTVTVSQGRQYTLSFDVNKDNNTAGDTGAFWVEILEGTTIIASKKFEGNYVTNGFESNILSYTASSTAATVRITGNSLANVCITGIMFSLGDVALQWSLSRGETYNTNVRIDLNGVRVSEIDTSSGVAKEKGFTSMSPVEFARWFDSTGDGNFEKVFYFNGDESVSKKVVAQNEITMGKIKVVKFESTTNKGWAFVRIVE